MRLRNRVAIVTGGSRGIGRAVSLRFAKEGAKVVVNYAEKADGNSKAADQVVKEIIASGGQAAVYEADVSNRKKMFAMVDFAVKNFCQRRHLSVRRILEDRRETARSRAGR
jgi:NAD(P)-dependent dehydrogenase (short-subunit alcohol dehydrogenase family)